MRPSVSRSSKFNRSRRNSLVRLETRQHSRQPKKRKPPQDWQHSRLPQSNFRLILVWGVLFAAAFGLVLNLYQLQIVRSSKLLVDARKQQIASETLFTPRRPLVDRNGTVLAIDQPVYTLDAHPKLFKTSKQAIATQLAAILNRSPADLVDQFNKRDSGIRLATALPEEIGDQIKQEIAKGKINGLDLNQHYSRLYPQQNLVAGVVGYVDSEHRGQAGVEYSQEKLLERSPQSLHYRNYRSKVPENFIHVDDLQLQLTLDVRLQRAARSALRQTMEQYGAKRGSVIVMDAQDGSLLTMVSEPSYNPNKYYESDMRLFQNLGVSDAYEPGSTLKPLNIAIALEAGVIKPNTVFNDSGSIKVAGWTIKNAEGEHRGALTIAQILQYSSNVGMVQVMQQMKPEDYYNWLKRLGLGKTLVTDLGAQAPSYLKSQKQFTSSPIEPATAAFGQGLSLTPIQLVQLHGALANGGKLVTPHVVQGLFDSNGQPHWQPKLPAPRQVFSPATTKTVVEMMETVVKGGTGELAQIPGYRIAGKTGTAQIANLHGGGYSNAQITSFIGIVPVESPRYVVLAVVDEPRGNVFGATVAAPVVKSVMEALLSLEQIPPTQPIVEATPSPESQRGEKKASPAQ